jgi:hypothetical protein
MAKIKKFDDHSQEQKLSDEITGKINYENQINLLLNDRSRDWYIELGKYFFKILNGEIPGNWGTYLKDKTTKETDYLQTSILFVTTFLDANALRKMFGEPLYHSEFGEGFEKEKGKPRIKEQYASYFVNVNGVECHIGYDHRGTAVEVEKGTSVQKCFDTIKSLMDIYKEKCCN